MFAQVSKLEYWKSEHDETTCEDACKDDSLRGLFALSDGAGTTLFSNVWAQVLVDQFISLPFMSNDPFEVEWWIRQAQEVYKARIASVGTLSWNARQKAQSEGSFATLAALRIVEARSSFAQAELQIIGDSCAFIEDGSTGHFQPFPLIQESDFDLAPICFASKLSLFNRYFQRCLSQQIDIASGDTIVLASDAVARWIISAGNGRYTTSREALHEVMKQTPFSWAQFILACRKRKEMIDDDCTALIVSFHAHTQQLGNNLLLGATSEHDTVARIQRKKAFEQAVLAQNKELMAIYYGDGKMLALESVSLSPAEIQQARQVADALRTVLSALREALDSPKVATLLGPIWQQYAPILATEPCAAHLRQTLARLGIPVASSAQPSLSIPHPSPSLVAPFDAFQSVAHAQPPVEEPAHPAPEPFWQFASPDPDEPQSPLLAPVDAKALFAMEQTIQQPLYTPEEIALSVQYTQLIEPAQYHHLQRLIHAAIAQGDIQQMADAYMMVQGQSLEAILPEDDLKRLALAHAFYIACKYGNNDQLIIAFEDILHSPYHGFFAFSPDEEALVTQAWQLKMSQTISSAQEANSPTISDSWFRKVCIIKELYLVYKQEPPLPPEHIQNQTIEDLANDQYIQEAIEEVNNKSFRKQLNPEALINDEFRAFRSTLAFDYDSICTTCTLSDDEVKAALRIFLRAQIFAQYLQKKQVSLHDWLDVRKREGRKRSSLLASTRDTGRSKLLWWRR